jgi:superfamily II DNA/RNA helicase
MLNYLKNTGFDEPTKIQSEYCVESDKFTLLLANTGSGKTLAFLLKMAKDLAENPENQVLILSPTRELAIQLYDVLKTLRLPYSNQICYGGHNFKDEVLQFQQEPRIVVATPGRILDHYERQTPGLNKFKYLIIDEYDKTLEFGFLNELERIYEYCSKIENMQLISATEIQELPNFISNLSFRTFSYLDNKKPDLSFHSIEAENNDKLKSLALLLTTFKNEPSIIFCNHREATERIAQHLFEYGKETEAFHGGLDQHDRERAIFKFKNGTVNCLISTDLAARGIDISDIQHIIHYQFPHTLEDYTHRNGRTARMDKKGKVYVIHSQEEPLPEYIDNKLYKEFLVPENFIDYQEAENITLFLNIGRKQKIRKMDIVGYLTTELKLDFKNIGQILVSDNYSYFALNSKSHSSIKHLIRDGIKIKKMNAKLKLCR